MREELERIAEELTPLIERVRAHGRSITDEAIRDRDIREVYLTLSTQLGHLETVQRKLRRLAKGPGVYHLEKASK